MQQIHTLSVSYGKRIFRIMENDFQYLIYMKYGNSFRFEGVVYRNHLRKNASAYSIINEYFEN